MGFFNLLLFFFQAEDGIRDLVRSRGLGDVYKRQQHDGGERERSGRLGQFEFVRTALNLCAGVGLSLIHI